MSSADSLFLYGCLCSSFSLFALLLVALYAFLWRRRNDIGGRRFSSAADFVSQVSKWTGLEGSPREFAPLQPIYTVSFEGSRASGRRARVSFEAHGTRKSHEYYVHLSVAAEREPSFAVRRRGVVAKLLKTVGLVEEKLTGEARFDERFSVEFSTGDKKAFPLSEAQRAIVEKLFDGSPIEELVVESGWLRVAAKEWRLDPASYDAVLSLLDELSGTLGKPAS